MKKFAPVACVSVAALLAADHAVAQNLDVVKRPRPGYDAVGIPAGSFIVFPHAELSVEYDSNIYAEATNEQDDFIAVLPLGVDVDSDWNNHALNLFAEGEFGFYGDNSDEDYEDYAVGFDGRIDVQRSFHIFGGSTFRHLHQDRGSPDRETSTIEPIEFDRTEANLGVTWKPNRLGVTIEGLYHHFDFDDATRNDGEVLNNDDRDRERMTGRLRVSYDLQPGYAAFVQGSYNEVEYANTPDDKGLVRDSDGFNFRGGVEFDITDVVSGDVFIGYKENDYTDEDLDDVDIVDVGGNILWGVTPLTTVRINLSRSIEETTQDNSPGYIATDVGIGIDHELRHNLLVGGTFGYVNNDYESIARDDDILSLSLRTTYMIDRTFQVGANAGWRDRDSNIDDASYDRFQVGAWVGVRF